MAIAPGLPTWPSPAAGLVRPAACRIVLHAAVTLVHAGRLAAAVLATLGPLVYLVVRG